MQTPPRNEPPRAEPWVSIDEVAAHLGVGKDSVYRWIERRGLPARKVGKLWKLKLSEVDAWMRAEARPPPPARPSTAAAPRRHVLVVDDDALVRESLRDFLRDVGYGVLLAADGAAALELLAAPTTPRPGVIVLDLVMPRMSGEEFLLARAADPRLAAIPVLTVTAERRAGRGREALRKPLDLAALRGAIEELMGAP